MTFASARYRQNARLQGYVLALAVMVGVGCSGSGSTDGTTASGGNAGNTADASQDGSAGSSGGTGGAAGTGGTLDAAADVLVDTGTDGSAEAAAGNAGAGGDSDAGTNCGDDDDCVGNPAGSVCDTNTGDCVQCLPTDPGDCPSGQYCDPQTNTCDPGCDTDDDCSSDAGAIVCDVPNHTCVGCTSDDQCAPGLVCTGNSCQPGCTPQHDCQSGYACCLGSCADTSTDPVNCGACDTPCEFPNASGVCLGGNCALEACLPGFENCDQNAANGCETDTSSGGACSCVPNETRPCYTGPAGTEGVGECKGGVQTCNSTGTAWDACVGEVLPATESCYTAADDNCNGETNEGGTGCVCLPSSQEACYSGPPSTRNVGACADGTRDCNASGTAWGTCTGEVLPSEETCLTPVDDDCDGSVNELGGVGCACVPASTASCYSGPPGTEGVGACTAGTQECDAMGTGYGPCQGSVGPSPDVCTDSIDNNCNGVVNDGYTTLADGCVCYPGATTTCYEGPSGTNHVGTCKDGTAQCNVAGDGYGACVGQVVPANDDCTDSLDNDCNGTINDGFSTGGAGCVCLPGTQRTCYEGPSGTLGVGVCTSGNQTCAATGQSWGPCIGQIIPDVDSCLNATDDDCNGVVNDGFSYGAPGCICTPGVPDPCYEGPSGTEGVGPCHAGTATCNDFGTGRFACVNQVLPIEEICNNGINDNCAGPTDSDCITPCDIAAANRSSVGCTFYAVDTNPIHSFVPGDYAVAVSNIDATTTAHVVLEQKTGNTWAAVTNGSFTVSPLSLVTRVLPHRYVSGSALYAGGAYRITSDLPVIAYQFNPMDGSSSYLSDASLLLPSSAYDGYYIVPAWPYGPADGSVTSGWPAHIQIVASAPTTVKVTPTCETIAGTGIPSMVPNTEYSFTMVEGDYLQLTVRDFMDSFNGTYIESDAPVAVFTSNDCANVPTGGPYCCCEHLEEQVFGLQTWGKRYVAGRVPRRSAEPALWQIMAQQDNTTVTFDFNAQLTGLPASVTLNARQMVQYQVNGTATNPGDFLVTGDKPILVTQYMVASSMAGGSDGDPSQILTVPVEQYLDHYVVLVPSTWVNDYFVLTRPTGATVQVDGAAVTSGWVTAGSSAYEIARVNVSDGVHVLQGTAPFGVIVLGYDSYDSYGYPGGLDQQIINPIQ